VYEQKEWNLAWYNGLYKVTLKNTCKELWSFFFGKDICGISEIKVISWNGKWERNEPSNLGVKLKVNNSFMVHNNINVAILKGVKSFNL
jgi:hypothetical protein